MRQESNEGEYSEVSVTNDTFNVREADGCTSYKACGDINSKKVK